MKTRKILSAISLVLIFAANSVFAGSLTINDPSTSDKQKLVTYEVLVKAVPTFPSANDQYIVVITDEKGRKVVPAQTFRPGVWTYTFKEAGTFRGTRTAVLVSTNANQTGWIIPPSVLKGNFTGGSTYQFILAPLPAGKPGPDNH